MRPKSGEDARERAREILLEEHPEVREQSEKLKPRFEAITALIRSGRAVEAGRRSPRLERLAEAARALDCELHIEFVPAKDSKRR